MRVLLEYEAERKLCIDCQELAELVGDCVLDREKCPYEAQINLLVTDDEEIHRLNREFRDIDRATDVLSFPSVPFEAPAEYDILETSDEFFDPESGELLLGDIVISADHVLAQAEEYGHSVKREFCFLVAHSMLHLLGYDHMTPEEAPVMEQKQVDVLEYLKITRDVE